MADSFHSSAFGDNFKWGVSSSAFQSEGAYLEDGKGLSIWDEFCFQPGRIKGGHHAQVSSNFYNHYIQDIILMQYMNIRNFRFSISWPRIFPEGQGRVNENGIDYYNQVIDTLLEAGIEPWCTLYHWDLPLELEKKGGWVNREILNWFEEYVTLCISKFGDRVKNWMVLNEPMAFTGAGYFLGSHAPGRKGLDNFLAAAHHTALCQALGGRIIKSMNSNLNVGTTFSCAHIEPVSTSGAAVEAANRIDVLANRLFIEPLLGLGYPWKELKVLEQFEKFMLPSDESQLSFDMDFIGVQNYTREIVQPSNLIPYLGAKIVKAGKRNVLTTAMDWEIYPVGIYKVLKRFDSYRQIKKLIVTENGAAFDDKLVDGRVDDYNRIDFYRSYLEQVLRAKKEGVKVEGYFAWSFTDNFEWAEGYYPRFGLVYVDFQNQKRYIKASGLWYRNFLSPKARPVSYYLFDPFGGNKKPRLENQG